MQSKGDRERETGVAVRPEVPEVPDVPEVAGELKHLWLLQLLGTDWGLAYITKPIKCLLQFIYFPFKLNSFIKCNQNLIYSRPLPLPQSPSPHLPLQTNPPQVIIVVVSTSASGLRHLAWVTLAIGGKSMPNRCSQLQCSPSTSNTPYCRVLPMGYGIY